MGFLRICLRLPLIVALTCCCASAIAMTSLVMGRVPAARLRLRNRFYRTWARGFCRIVGMRVRVQGEPPRGAFMLVSNHLSYLDIMLLSSYANAAFVAKAGLRGWPVIGWLISIGDSIFIDRARKRDLLRAMSSISQTLARDLGVIVFPEGTTGSGEALLAFKPSLLEFAAKTGRPVHYSVLSYHLEGWRHTAAEALAWWGDASFLPHFFTMLQIPSFEADLVFCRTPVIAEDRKELAAALRAEMDVAFDSIK